MHVFICLHKYIKCFKKPKTWTNTYSQSEMNNFKYYEIITHIN